MSSVQLTYVTSQCTATNQDVGSNSISKVSRGKYQPIMQLIFHLHINGETGNWKPEQPTLQTINTLQEEQQVILVPELFHQIQEPFMPIQSLCFKRKQAKAVAHINPKVNHNNLETRLSRVISVFSNSFIFNKLSYQI